MSARAAKITVGPGRDDPDIGPLVSDEQHAKVIGHVEEAKRRGREARGGRRRGPGICRADTFVAPTIFSDVDPGLRIMREEVFGPVLTLTRFDSEADGLALANGLGYGLVAGVYTRDISRALRLAQRLEAGSVWINGWYIGGQQAPTGGIKDSRHRPRAGPAGDTQLSVDQERRHPAVAISCNARRARARFSPCGRSCPRSGLMRGRPRLAAVPVLRRPLIRPRAKRGATFSRKEGLDRDRRVLGKTLGGAADRRVPGEAWLRRGQLPESVRRGGPIYAAGA